MKFIYSMLMLILFHIGAQAQQDKLEIYIQDARYTFRSNEGKDFKKYVFLSNYYIDRNREDIINLEQLKEGIDRVIPNKMDSAFISLDIENQIYHDLKSLRSSTRRKAAKEFIKMVRFVKKLRPNSKVGIYGIPFSFNYDLQKYNNHYRELKPIIQEVDYISPSLYFHYSEQQQNDTELYQYIKNNLNLFLEYSHKLNKPVYLYVWYLVHPYNKKYGKTMVSKKRMKTFFKYIRKEDYKGTKIKGIIWWDSSDTSYNRSRGPEVSITDRLMEYTKPIR